MNIKELQTVLQHECANIRENWLRDKMQSFLIPPRKQRRIWEWEKEPRSYSIWVIADIRHRNVGIAYAEGGYGLLGKPWGLVFLDDQDGSPTGPDDAWYPTLESCLHDYGFAEDGDWWESS